MKTLTNSIFPLFQYSPFDPLKLSKDSLIESYRTAYLHCFNKRIVFFITIKTWTQKGFKRYCPKRMGFTGRIEFHIPGFDSFLTVKRTQYFLSLHKCYFRWKSAI